MKVIPRAGLVLGLVACCLQQASAQTTNNEFLAQRQQILDTHNSFRRLVNPPAADMKELVSESTAINNYWFVLVCIDQL